MSRPRIPALPAAFAVAVACEFGLRTVSLPRLARWLGVRLDLESGTAAADGPAVLPGAARPHVSAVTRVMRHWPFGDTCLRRSLVLGNRLRGYGPVLRIGVRRDDDGRLAAHSWLELGGRSLDPSGTRYGTLASASGPSSAAGPGPVTGAVSGPAPEPVSGPGPGRATAAVPAGAAAASSNEQARGAAVPGVDGSRVAGEDQA